MENLHLQLQTLKEPTGGSLGKATHLSSGPPKNMVTGSFCSLFPVAPAPQPLQPRLPRCGKAFSAQLFSDLHEVRLVRQKRSS